MIGTSTWGLLGFEVALVNWPNGSGRREEIRAATLATRVLGHETLVWRAWVGSHPTGNALSVHMRRMRHRTAFLGLAVRTVWGLGYPLQCADGAD